MKKVLILGAIESFCDIIEDAKEMKIQTIVTDYFPDDKGKKIANYAYDVSTTDTAELLKIAKKHDIDGIICAFSDRSIPVCYEIAQTLNLPTFYTPKTIENVIDKINMKKHLEKYGFPILKWRIIHSDFLDSEIEDFTFPVIIKPVDSSGSKGVFICKTIEEVREAFPESLQYSVSYKNEIIIEEYYPVDEISITAWVKNGKSYLTCVYDVGMNRGNTPVLSSVQFPSKYCSEENMKQFEVLVQDLTTSFCISEGPVTVQCYIGERGLKVGEYIYRLAGGSPYFFTEYLGGPNLAKMLLSYSVGEKIDYAPLLSFNNRVKRTVYVFRIYATSTGTITYSFDEKMINKIIPECSHLRIYLPSGTKIETIPTEGKIVAKVFCEIEDPQRVTFNSITTKLKENIVIQNEDGRNIAGFLEPEKTVTQKCYDL